MRVQLRRGATCDEGAIAIIVALLAVVIVTMAAFAVDLGNAYAVKRQLSVAADAAALDAARAVASTRVAGQPILGGGNGCVGADWSAAERAAAEAAAWSAAEATNAANDLSGESTVDDVEVYCRPDGTGVEVTVDNSRDLPVFFGGVANATGYEPARSATAAVVPKLAVGDLRPFAVCNTEVDASRVRTGETFTVELNNGLGLCGSTRAGNWGIVDFDGTSGGINDTKDWTEFGYPNPVEAPDSDLPVQTGGPLAALDTQLRPLVNQVILLPVVTSYTPGSGPGNNGRFDLVGFASVRVCGYYIGGPSPERGSCFSDAKAAPYLAERPRINFIQFRYVDYSTGYSGGGATCRFEDDECRYAILSAQLYR